METFKWQTSAQGLLRRSEENFFERTIFFEQATGLAYLI
jgi:hypothetical protein